MGNEAHWRYGAQGYGSHGQWGTWTMGYRGMGNRDKWAMGPMGDLHPKCQKDVNFSKRCQVVKKMSNVKKSNT